MSETIVTRTDADLIQAVKTAYPETAGLTATGVIDWSLRKIVTLKEVKS